MLRCTQNTGICDPKADCVDQSSAVVKHPLLQTCSEVTAHLPENSCLNARRIPYLRSSSQKHLHLKHIHVGQLQGSTLRSWV